MGTARVGESPNVTAFSPLKHGKSGPCSPNQGLGTYCIACLLGLLGYLNWVVECSALRSIPESFLSIRL